MVSKSVSIVLTASQSFTIDVTIYILKKKFGEFLHFTVFGEILPENPKRDMVLSLVISAKHDFAILFPESGSAWALGGGRGRRVWGVCGGGRGSGG